MKSFLSWLFAAAAIVSLAGCGDGGNANIVEDADQSALEAYEAAIEADAAAMDQDMESETGL